jgi:hypothetical protein
MSNMIVTLHKLSDDSDRRGIIAEFTPNKAYNNVEMMLSDVIRTI